MTLFRTSLFLMLLVQVAYGTEFEESKALHPGFIGSQLYAPTKKEKQYIQKTPPTLMEFGALMSKDMLKKKKGDYISWFAIAREITKDPKSHSIRFVGESKYFSGLSDVHLQTVSINGAGDFVVQCDSDDFDLVPAALVRVYGRIKDFDKKGQPVVDAEYIREWPWGFFNFMDYKEEVDASAPKRREGLHLDGLRIYSMHPQLPQYYQERLAVSPEELEAEYSWWLKNGDRIRKEDEAAEKGR